MARLTWENVNAPSFAGVSDAYRTMGALLNNATQAGSEVLDTFRGAQNEAADRALLQRAIGIQDPTAYRAALADGSLLGSDASRASVRGLQALDNRVGSLIANATNQNGLDWTQYNQDRARSGNQVLDANSDAINRARSLAVAGDMSGAQRLLSGVPGLRADQFNEILGDVDQYGSRALGRDVTRLGMDVTRQNLTEDRYGFGRLMMGDTATDEAQGVLREIQRSASTPQDARIALEGMADRLSPQTFARAQQMLAQAGYGNVYAPVGAGGAPAAPGGGLAPSAAGTAGTQRGNPYDTVVGFGAFGNSQKPITSMTIGEAMQFGKDVLIPGTRNNSSLGLSGGKGSSAMGAYQITQGTLQEFAPKVLGTNWRDQPMSAENQEKIAEAIFEARKGGNLKETWASLPDTRPGAYANRIWQEVRQEIAQREVGAQLPSATESGFAGLLAGLQTTERTSQNNARGITADYGNAITGTRSAAEVAAGLVGEGGAYSGTNQDLILSEINRLVNRSGGRISPDVAGAMLERSATSAGGTIARGLRRAANIGGLNPMADWLGVRTPTLANNQRIDEEALDTMADDFLSGASSQRFVANQSAAVAQQMAQQATATYQSALAQYQAVLLDSQTRPGAAQNLPRYREALQQAKANMDAVLQRVGGNENWNPDWDVPEPDPVTGLISSAVKG